MPARLQLVYVDDSLPGITRKKMKLGWGYFDASGKRITDRDEIDRLNAIAMPPAYRDCWFCPSPHGHIQATGYDERGRKQYRYHPDFRAAREAEKYAGCPAFGRALPRIVANAQDVEARGDALYGAWLCGIVLGSVGMALHHKLCHTLGGSFNLPHADTHTVVLPHALAYNAAAAPQAMQRIARALGRADGNAAQAVFDLAQANGAPVALRDIGMKAEDLDKACSIALQNQYPNPRPLEAGAIRQLLQDAFDGRRP